MDDQGPIASVCIFHRGLSVFDEGAELDEILEKVLLYLPSYHSQLERVKALGMAEGLIDFARKFKPDSDSIETVKMERSILAFKEVEPEIWLVIKANKEWEDPNTQTLCRMDWENSELLVWLQKMYQTYMLFFGSVTEVMEKVVDFEKQSSLHTWLLSRANVKQEKRTGMELMKDILKTRKTLRKLRQAEELQIQNQEQEDINVEEVNLEEMGTESGSDLTLSSPVSKSLNSEAGQDATNSDNSAMIEPTSISAGRKSSPNSFEKIKQELMSLLIMSPAEAIRQYMSKFFPDYIAHAEPETFRTLTTSLSGFKVTALDPAIMLAITRLETSLFNRFEDLGLMSVSILFQGEVLWCSSDPARLALLVNYMQTIGISTQEELGRRRTSMLKGKKESDLSKGCFGAILSLSPGSVKHHKQLEKQWNSSDEDMNESFGKSFVSKGYLTTISTALTFIDSTGQRKMDTDNAMRSTLWLPDIHKLPYFQEQKSSQAPDQDDDSYPEKLAVYYYGPLTFIIFFTEPGTRDDLSTKEPSRAGSPSSIQEGKEHPANEDRKASSSLCDIKMEFSYDVEDITLATNDVSLDAPSRQSSEIMISNESSEIFESSTESTMAEKVSSFFEELEVFIAPELNSFVTIILQRLRKQASESNSKKEAIFITHLEQNQEHLSIDDEQEFQASVKVRPEDLSRLKSYLQRIKYNLPSGKDATQELIVKLDGSSNEWIVNKRIFLRELSLSFTHCPTLIDLNKKLLAFEEKEMSSKFML